MGKCFGVRVDLAKRTVRPPDHPMPEWTRAVVERMNGLGLEHFAPNECMLFSTCTARRAALSREVRLWARAPRLQSMLITTGDNNLRILCLCRV
eukprot:gene1860-6298_t